MKTIAVKVLSEQSNHAIVQLPARQFPGSVIQGDSLAILCAEAKAISQGLLQCGCADPELLGLAQEHQENLLERLLHFQQILSDNGVPLPYTTAAKPSDLVALLQDGDDHAL